MKLYEVPAMTWIKVAGERIVFDHLDGMDSYCLYECGNHVHVAACEEVEIEKCRDIETTNSGE